MKSLRTALRFARANCAVGAAFALALTFAAALPCAADTLTVDSIADDGLGTLRAALASATDGDTIDFSVTGTIALTSGQLVVDKNLTITGPGQDLLTVDGQQLFRVFYIAPGATVAISHLTIANGKAAAGGEVGWAGGGIWNEGGVLTLSDCTLSGNQAVTGGAVFNEGTLTLTDCALSDNTAWGYSYDDPWNADEDAVYARGGAIVVVATPSDHAVSLTLDRCTLSGNTARGDGEVGSGLGGGIFVGVFERDAPTVTVMNSTLVGNTASGAYQAYGGAIVNGDVAEYVTGGNLIIRNSTLAGNAALGDAYGGMAGAIFNLRGSLTLDNSTVSGNYDDWEDSEWGDSGLVSGAIVNASGSLKIKNTLLANDLPTRNLLSLAPAAEGEEGPATLPIDDLGFNLCTDDCSDLLDPTTNLLNVADPMLGPLADNGGPTLTRAPLPGSPAIDVAAASDSFGEPVAFDQRGVARPQGSANDIGAVEIEQATVNAPPTADPGGPYLAAVNAQFAVDGSASSDPEGDSLNYRWEFGNTIQTDVSPSFVALAEPGIYPLILTVDDGLSADTVSTSVVVYDASAGFVTGGGWIDSPAGAYFADPDLAGKATFGFVSKYHKGATVPTGSTAFTFAAGDLHLDSTSYEWLLVTGSDYARFKGSGTINGMGDYRFMVWAGDNEPDTFSIRIWQEDEATGVETDIYDNGFDQPIGGGSIVIHTR